MPYIKPESREYIDLDLALALDRIAVTGNCGDLNYVLTRLIVTWLGKSYGYAQLNAAIGVLECAKLELYRKMAVPYENAKCIANGDVYPLTKARPLRNKKRRG